MILIFSGTVEGRVLAAKLILLGYRVVVSTATQHGANMIKQTKNLDVIYGKLELEQLKKLIREKDISVIVDATHPYAKNISKNLIDACKDIDVELIRYERPSVIGDKYLKFDTFEEICKFLNTKKGNVLMTTGSNNLDAVSENMDLDRVFVRVLPTANVINKTIALGFKPSNIIGMQGPFSVQLNEAIIEQFNIKYLVTKDSGNEGGAIQKLLAASNKNVKVIVLRRPYIDYGKAYSEIQTIIEKISAKKDKLCI